MAPPSASRISYTEEDDAMLINFLAKYTSDGHNRRGNDIYMKLVANNKKFLWARRHPWMSWREHYVKNQDLFDKLIERTIDEFGYSRTNPKRLPLHPNSKTVREYFGSQNASPTSTRGNKRGETSELLRMSSRKPQSSQGSRKPQSSQGRSSVRHAFTEEDDYHLARYIAKLDVDVGRTAPNLYKTLTENTKKRPWAARHTASSWQTRYTKNRDEFDRRIRRYRKKGIVESDTEVEHVDSEADGTSERDDNDPEQTDGEAAEETSPAKRKGASKRKRSEDGRDDPAKKKKRRVDGPNKEDNRTDVVRSTTEAPAASSSPKGERQINRTTSGSKPGERAPELDGTADISSQGRHQLSGRSADHKGPPSVITAQPSRSEEQDEDQDEAELDAPADNDQDEDDKGPKKTRMAPPAPNDYRGEIFDEAAEDDQPAEDEQPRIEAFTDDVVDGDEENEEEVDELDPDTDEEGARQKPRSKIVKTSIQKRDAIDEDRDEERLYPDVPSHPPRSVMPTTVDTGGVEASGRPQSSEQSLAPEPSNSRQAIAGPSSLVPSTPTAHPAKKRSRPSLVRRQQEFFAASATATPDANGTRTPSPLAPSRPREPPRLDRGAYNSAFTDAFGRPRLSPRGRVYGVDQDAEAEESLQRDVEVVAWPPPRRGKKGKEKETERVPPIKPELSKSQAAFAAKGRRGGSPDDVLDHHPFSQIDSDAQLQSSRLAVVDQPHHPFSQALPPTQDYTATQIAAALDALMPDEEESVVASQPKAAPLPPDLLLDEDDMRVLDQMLQDNALLLENDLGDLIAGYSSEASPGKINLQPEPQRVLKPVRSVSPRLEEILQPTVEPQCTEDGDTAEIPNAADEADVAPEQAAVDEVAGSANDAEEQGKDVEEQDEQEEDEQEQDEQEQGEQEQDEQGQDEEEEEEPAQELPLPHRRRTLPSRLSREISIYPQAESSRIGRAFQRFQTLPPGLEWLQEHKLMRKMMDEDMLPPYAKLDLYAATAGALTKLSQEHGFTEEVVLEKWFQAGALHKVEFLLREMREGAEERAEEVSESMMVDDDPSEPGESMANWSRSNSLLSSRRGSGSRRQSKQHRRRSILPQNKNVSRFEIELLPPEPANEEYDPHPNTRAGRYVKLARVSSFDGNTGLSRGAMKRRPSSNADATAVEMILDGIEDD